MFYFILTKTGETLADFGKCPNPVGYFVSSSDACNPDAERLPAACHRWDCVVCGPKKLRRLKWQLNKALRGSGWRWRHLTLTLQVDYKEDIMKCWNRFRASLRKAGYIPQFFWVKEFQENGQRHLHILVSAFIPFGVIQHLWKLATDGTSWRVKITQTQIRSGAAYLTKYLTKGFLDAPFRSRERRYGMSKALRSFWPAVQHVIDPELNWTFVLKPDTGLLLRKGRETIHDRKERLNAAKAFLDDIGLHDTGKHRIRYKYKKRKLFKRAK